MKKEQWYPFVMLGCATAVNFVYLGMACNVLGLYTPSILAEFPAFSRSAFAVTVTLVNLMAAVGNMLHEPVLRRMPVRGMLCLGLCTVMLGLLAYSLADRLSLFYLGGGFLGLGIGFCSSGTVALMVNAWFAKRSGTFVSVAMSGTGISVALFSLIVSRMIDAWGWRAAFRMMGVLVAVFGLLIVCVYRSTPKAAGLPGRWGEEKDGTPRAEEKESRRGSLWKNPVYRAFMALIFLMGIVLYAVMNNISVIASDMNFSIIQIGYFSSVIFVVNVVSQLPVGMTCDRFGSRGILYAAFSVMAAVYLLFFLVRNIPFLPMLMISVIFGFGKTVMNNLTVFIVQEIASGEERSRLVSVGVALMSLGTAAGTYIVQLGYDLSGSYRGIYVLFIGLSAICMFLNFYLQRRNL